MLACKPKISEKSLKAGRSSVLRGRRAFRHARTMLIASALIDLGFFFGENGQKLFKLSTKIYHGVIVKVLKLGKKHLKIF